MNINEIEVPVTALSAKYRERGAFIDCYCIDLPKDISLEQYIQSFYTTTLFKLERTVLSIATLKSASDKDAVELSLGLADKYSIWSVESRRDNQILLADFTGKTKSWLMVQRLTSTKTPMTRLYFGSVVIPKTITKNGQVSFGAVFHLLSKFHQIYSRALLKAATQQLLK